MRKLKPLAASITALATLAGGLTVSIPTLAQSVAVEESVALEEIIVTARRREESLQDVPIAVTVVSGDELIKRGVSDFTELTLNNPNVSISQSAAGAISNIVAIRGNVQNAETVQLDPAVGTYVDGFVAARTFGMGGSMIDIDNVQTLKGPQGTLFGRNTTGGAILINTRNPDVDEGFGGYLRAEAGQVSSRSYTGAVNIPLADNLAMRLVAHHAERGDYQRFNDPDGIGVTDELGGMETEMLRAKVLWNITDRTSALFSAERVDVDATSTMAVATQPNHPRFTGNSPVAGTFLDGQLQTPTVGSDQEQSASVETFNLTVTHDTEWGEVKLLTGQRRMDVGINVSLPPGLGKSVQDKPDLRQFSAELQLNGSFMDDRLDLTSGLYYFDESTTEDQLTTTYQEIQDLNLGLPVIANQGLMDTEMESVSAYVQGTYSLTDTTNLTLGGRYTYDDRESVGFLNSPNTLSWDDTEGKFNYLITLDHRFIPDLMVYISTGTGYRSGGATIGKDPNDPNAWASFLPEEVTSYEAGFKSDLLDGSIRLNGAVFYQNYSDYQFTEIVINPDTGAPVRNAQTSDVTIKGGELEVTVLLPKNFTVSLNYGYTDGKLSGGGGALPAIPKHSIGATLGKAFPTDLGEVDLRATYDYRDSFFTQVGALASPATTIESRGLLNLSATLDTGTWTASAYVNNVTNEAYYEQITFSPSSPQAAGLFGLSFASIGLPRVAGVKFGYNF